MNIIFFSHYYTPEGNAPASRTAEHCARWVKNDKDVNITVITCAPNVPDGNVYEGYKNRFWPQREVIDGVNVLRVWTYLRPNPTRLQLIFNYISYLFSALFAFVFLTKRPHVIVATSPQFFCGIAGVVASYLKWRPLVLEIRDIWPESIVTVGAFGRNLAIRILERMERWMYRSASHIVTVGPGYRENILEKVDVGDRISVVTNGVSIDQFQPADGCIEFEKRYGLSDRFVCSYVGTVGRAHGLDILIRAAERLKTQKRNDIVFLVVGGGAKLETLRSIVAEKELDDFVRLTGRLDKKEMPHALAASDACLVHLKQVELFEKVIPSKIFETMAMERPIIMGVRGRARDIVLSANSGVAMEPENDGELIEILNDMVSDPEGTLKMGRNGRQFVADYFNRDALAQDMLGVIRRTACGDRFKLEDRDWGAKSGGIPAPLDLEPMTTAGNSVR